MSNNLGARLRTAKDSLATWYDRLNSQWADAEKTLRSFNLSSDVWAPFKGETDEDDCDLSGNILQVPYSRDIEYCLAFMKHDGEWRICYAVGEVGDPDSYAPHPILDCSLEDRKLALEGLPTLLEAVVKKAETESATLEVALGAAAEALGSIKRAV